MTLDRQQLLETLDQLHNQLEEADNLDPESAAHLRATMVEIQQALDEQSLEADHQETLIDRLRESARHFEETHPRLSVTLGSLVDTLGQIGI